MSHAANKPIYFIPPGHPDILHWKEQLEQYASSGIHTLRFQINPQLVDGLEVARIQQLTFALQHYPSLIERFVFALEFDFRQIADSELYYQEQDWKNDPKVYRWFHQMYTQPHLLFFLQDHDARFYFLIGDWLVANKVTIQPAKQGKRHAVSLNAKQVEEMANRFFICCRMFNLYCHGTGVKALPYIEALIAEYNFEESNMSQMLFEQYYQDIAKGVTVSAVPLKNY
jgi:hypothetical protein